VIVTWIRAVGTVTFEIIDQMIEATDQIVAAVVVPWPGVIEHSLKNVTGKPTDALSVAANEKGNMRRTVRDDEADLLAHLYAEVRAAVAHGVVLGLALESGPGSVLDPVPDLSAGAHALGVALLPLPWILTAMYHLRVTEANHLGAGSEVQRESESEIRDLGWVILTGTCRPLKRTTQRFQSRKRARLLQTRR
jgi:hypothetical protein